MVTCRRHGSPPSFCTETRFFFTPTALAVPYKICSLSLFASFLYRTLLQPSSPLARWRLISASERRLFCFWFSPKNHQQRTCLLFWVTVLCRPGGPAGCRGRPVLRGRGRIARGHSPHERAAAAGEGRVHLRDGDGAPADPLDHPRDFQRRLDRGTGVREGNEKGFSRRLHVGDLCVCVCVIVFGIDRSNRLTNEQYVSLLADNSGTLSSELLGSPERGSAKKTTRLKGRVRACVHVCGIFAGTDETEVASGYP